MKYLEEMTGAAAAGGTTTGDVATYARPVGAGPVKRIYPFSVTGVDSARITLPLRKGKSKRK